MYLRGSLLSPSSNTSTPSSTFTMLPGGHVRDFVIIYELKSKLGFSNLENKYQMQYAI
jgi:hypothetical protein